MNNLIPYNPKLREFARFLRNNSTFPEILLWKEIKNKSLGVEFKRQVPIIRIYCRFLLSRIKVSY